MPKELEPVSGIHEELFEEMLHAYMEAAADAVTSIVKMKVEISSPQMEVMELKKVDYCILEPAMFVKNCLTSHMAGTMMQIFRERDIQILLNRLMGIDELARPDFEFDEISISAVREIMNQMAASEVSAMAESLGNQMESSECQIHRSVECQGLASVMGEEPDSQVTVITYKLKLDDVVDSEYIQVLSREAVDNLQHEIKERAALLEAEAAQKAREQEAVRPGASSMEKVTGQDLFGAGAQNLQAPPWEENIPYKKNMGLIMNVPLQVTVEIGRARRKLKDILNFNNGTIVELEKQADAPVDIIVNGQLIARGNVVVIDDNFGVRITEIVNTKNILGNGELG